ncbi:MAG: S9 family peptidase, partial [Paludibacteraceae bacterium]|nr:S9 family peptidase [Paludibacteraceae bacterium]
MKRLSLLLFTLSAVVLCRADLLDDITTGQYRAKSGPQLTPLYDGQHYAQMADKRHVFAYDYQTGQPTDTLFDAQTTRLMQIDSIDGFVVGPNERYLLVYNNKKGIYRRSFKADYYIVDLRRNELKPLSPGGGQMIPTFSPNGRYIAFVRDNNIYIHKVDFGTEVAVTTDGQAGSIINGATDWLYEEEFAVTNTMTWSPDSKQLAFVRLDESEVQTMQMQLFLNQQTTDKLQLYPTIESFKYPKAGEVNAKATVCVYDTYYKSVKTMQLPNDDDCYVPRIRWTQDVDQLAIFQLNRQQNELNMYWANPKSTICRRMYTERDEAYVDYSEVDEWQFLSDGGFVVVNETDGYRNIYLYDHNGSLRRQLTKGTYDITACYGLDEQTQTLYFQAATPTPMQRQIYALSLRKGSPTRLTSEDGWHSASFNPSRTYFVDTYSSLTTPTRVTVRSATGKTLRTLVDNRQLTAKVDSLRLPKKEWISVPNAQGDMLNGWMVKPAEAAAGQPCPVLMVQYSGPNSQLVKDQWKMDWEYYLAQQGIIVVCVDGRGTGARGSKFRKCTYRHLGRMEAEDQQAVARWLGRQDYVDAERIGIWGWSYGGYQVLYSMSTGTNLFRCGIAVAPVTSWRFYDSAYAERFMNRPQQNESYTDSPLQMAGQLNGRLLLVSGTADDNVHFQNTLQYIQALVQAGKQFDLMVYPDDNHFLRHDRHYPHLYRMMFEF